MMSATHAATTGLPMKDNSLLSCGRRAVAKRCSHRVSLPRTPGPPDPARLRQTPPGSLHGPGPTKPTMPHIIPDREIEFSAVRSQGPGGQNVNQVSSAVHLRFDIRASSLPQALKDKLLATADHRITKEGVIVIKAQTTRSQEQNRAEAVARLHEMVEKAAQVQRVRRPTKPTFGSKQRRLKSKSVRAGVKAGRGRVTE